MAAPLLAQRQTAARPSLQPSIATPYLISTAKVKQGSSIARPVRDVASAFYRSVSVSRPLQLLDYMQARSQSHCLSARRAWGLGPLPHASPVLHHPQTGFGPSLLPSVLSSAHDEQLRMLYHQGLPASV